MRSASAIVATLAAFAMSGPDARAEFAAFVIPARHELQAKPGQVVREILEIGNDSAAQAEYRVRTADWKLRPDGGVEFVTDTLLPDSCRSWVRIERHQVKVAGKSKRRYRFEVHVPADAAPGLCRFAVLIEAADDALTISPLENIRIPVQGRLGVIVYLRVGDVRPELAFERLELRDQGGAPMPYAVFTNTGKAHGRPEGYLSGSDATGKRYEFLVSPFPILPGETRGVAIAPQAESAATVPRLVPPVRLKGTIEWDGGKKEIDGEAK